MSAPTDVDVEVAQQKLLSKLGRCTETYRSLSGPLVPLRQEGENPEDLASNRTLRIVNDCIGSSQMGQAKEVVRALQKIKEGTYGTCDGCGGPIGKERLEALPHASLCIKCKATQERSSRR